MPRQARMKGEFTIYHVILRGNERKNIFLSDGDKVQFIDTLIRMKEKHDFLLYAYCLMNNHVHLLLDDNGNDISQIMRSINISYVIYFNRKYDRCGHLFQDRFRSEPVLDDSYLLQASKYIHNNPVKAHMVHTPDRYIWSSFRDYIKKNEGGLVDTDKILGSISTEITRAAKQYADYVTDGQEVESAIMDVEENSDGDIITTLDEARERIEILAEENHLSFDELINRTSLRNQAIRKVRENSSLTLKEIGKLFGGISESRVSRILR